MREIIKLAGCEVYADEVERHTSKGEIYICKYRTVYQIHHSRNAGYYATKLYYQDKAASYVPITLRGHYTWADGEFLNKLVEFQLVDETIRTV